MIPMEIHPSCLIASPAQLAPIALGWATRLKHCPCFRATGDYHVTRLTYASALTSTRALLSVRWRIRRDVRRVDDGAILPALQRYRRLALLRE